MRGNRMFAGSVADEAGVEGAGYGGICGALDEGAAIGEDGDGVGAAREAEEHGVCAQAGNAGLANEGGVEGGEVERAGVLVYLDRVAAAEGDVRAGGAGEVGEGAGGLLVGAADEALGVRTGSGDFAALVGPKIPGEEGAAEELRLVGEKFECLVGLKGGGEVNGGGEDAGGIAGFCEAGGRGGEEAGEAGGGGFPGDWWLVQPRSQGRDPAPSSG